MSNTKGILLIAAGHHYYGELAANLAATIKAVDMECKIALAKTEGALATLSPAKRELFDEFIEIPPEAYTTDGRTEWIKTKTHIYDLSPWDLTLFLDVDMVYIARTSPIRIIESFEAAGLAWTMQNTGNSKYSVWCEIMEVKEKYGEDAELWSFHSEFIYFRKCDEAAAYFDQVKRSYEDPGLDTLREFGGARLADELAFQLASIETKQYPHLAKFTPVFWYARDKADHGKHFYELRAKYCAASVGGNKTPSFIKNNYDIIVRAAFKKLGIPYPFKFKDKIYYIPERRQI